MTQDIPPKVLSALGVVLEYLKTEIADDLLVLDKPTEEMDMITTQEVMAIFGKFGLGSHKSIKRFANQHNITRVFGHTNRYSKKEIELNLRK